MIAYEKLLDGDTQWAFLEGSMHFEKESAVHKALMKIVKRLDELGIDYAVAGGMALFFHGFRRFTEDVDILVNRESISKIHDELSGLGYLPVFSGSKNLRDTECGVGIKFIIAGDYPGDGKPKPVAFPNPADISVEIERIHFVNLPTLVELKLASGMTNAMRLQDIADVQRMIHDLDLPMKFAEKLNPYVQEQFRDLRAIIEAHESNREP